MAKPKLVQMEYKTATRRKRRRSTRRNPLTGKRGPKPGAKKKGKRHRANSPITVVYSESPPKPYNSKLRRSATSPERELTTFDYQIVVCRAFGLTRDQTAERIRTPEFPEGTTVATLDRHMEANAEWFKREIDFCATIRRMIVVREARPLTKLTIKDEFENALGASWASIKAEIDNGNAALGQWVIEQVIGKPKQRSEIAVDAQHQHEHRMVWQPERKLLAQEGEIEKSDRLLRALPRDVVEAVLVMDASAPSGAAPELTNDGSGD